MYICAVPLDVSITEGDYAFLLTHVSEEMKAKIERYRFKEDAYRSLFGRILLKYILAKYYGIFDYQILYSENGKPYLKAFAHIHFSISHSGDWVLCAADDKEIGIDVETVKPFQGTEKILSLAKMFMQQEEIDFLLTKEGEERTLSFYDFWTGKEATIKYLGSGIGAAKKYRIYPNEMGATIVKGHEKQLYIHRLEIGAGYRASVCTDEGIFDAEARANQEGCKREIEFMLGGDLVDFFRQ